MDSFRRAAEARDAAALETLLAENVVFTSPVAHQPYPGKAMTAAILRGVLRVFEDFRYEREISSPDGRDHALMFRATVDGKDLQGCDFLHLDDDGLIDSLTVMVRPLSAANALAAGMAAQFDQIKTEATAQNHLLGTHSKHPTAAANSPSNTATQPDGQGRERA